MAINPASDARAYASVRALVSTKPPLEGVGQYGAEQYEWLARIDTVLEPELTPIEVAELRVAIDGTKYLGTRVRAVQSILMLAYRAKARIERRLPGDAQGAFIGISEELNAMQAIATIVGDATDVLIVDPYLDHSAIFELLVVIPEDVNLMLLADSHHRITNDQARTAVGRWRAQYGAARPISLRFTQPRVLHDRALIMGATRVYLVSQSLKDLAARSPATIQRLDEGAARLKSDFYQQLWQNSAPDQ